MTTQPQTRPDWAEQIDRNRQNVSYVLIGLGGALIIAAIVLAFWKGWDTASLSVGFLLFGLTSLGCGLWFQAGLAPGLSGKDSARLLVLILGGALGLAVTVAAICQTKPWWEYVSGGTEVWQDRSKSWHLWLLAGLYVVGLAVMFFSFLLGRGEESDSPTLRRLLYGYNAVLTGLLLLGILAAINVLAYLYLPQQTDWTEAGIYTLSSKSQSLLKNLKQPVTVYVLEAQRGGRFDTEMRDLMENVRSVTDKVSAEYVMRDLNRQEMARLKALYTPSDDHGLIVVYGSGDNAPHTFIPERDVLPQAAIDPRTGRPTRGDQSFKGEDRLMSAIATLQEGKKPVVYFTQGNGELDVFGTVQGLPPERQGRLLADGLAQKDNYEVKGLILSDVAAPGGIDPRIVVAKSVPDDASAVIIAGPTRPFGPDTIAALQKYMREPHKDKDPTDGKEVTRKGKLMVLLGAVAGTDGKMTTLKLDELLREYDVDLTNDRVLQLVKDPQPERDVVVTPRPELRGSNPLVTLFEGAPLYMNGLRVVRSSTAPPAGAGPRFQASDLLVTAPPPFGPRVVTTNDMGQPGKIIAELIANKRPELVANVRPSVSVAVAVSDPGERDMSDPHAFMNPTSAPGTPRVEVIGDSDFVSNDALAGRGGEDEQINAATNYALFASALAWLREKPGSMGIEPKKRDSYSIGATTNFLNMLVFPFSLMFLGITGLGLGVWVVRRR